MRIKPSLIIQTLNKGVSPAVTVSLLGIHKATVYRDGEKRLVIPEANLVAKTSKENQPNLKLFILLCLHNKKT